MIEIINQIFAITLKCKTNDFTAIDRNLDRLQHELTELGFRVINPLGDIYKITSTDIEATISTNTNSDIITKVLKPIIYKTNEAGAQELIQKGIVIVG